jgi:hypothetical protein
MNKQSLTYISKKARYINGRTNGYMDDYRFRYHFSEY